MRILTVGFLVLAAWMTFSTWIYVCKVQGLCQEPLTSDQVSAPGPQESPSDSIAMSPVEETVVVPADEIIYFAFDRSEVRADPSLENYILESKAYLDQNQQARLRFTGHTCSIGTDAYNQALGMRRAQSTKQYFETKGIPVNNSIVESRGEQEPMADNQTASGRKKNRRTVISIIQ